LGSTTNFEICDGLVDDALYSLSLEVYKEKGATYPDKRVVVKLDISPSEAVLEKGTDQLPDAAAKKQDLIKRMIEHISANSGSAWFYF